MDRLGGGIQERHCLIIEFDERNSGIAVFALAGYPQGGSGRDESLGVPEVVLRPAGAGPLRGGVFDCSGGAQREGDLCGGDIQWSPPGQQGLMGYREPPLAVV
ncbi:MAG: hypothetical protein M3460_18525, partial [Actinomycetota bacterium]|nr:hypothetical protein [Actinomycetota bacterium]